LPSILSIHLRLLATEGIRHCFIEQHTIDSL
jgi:hypothetical protein